MFTSKEIAHRKLRNGGYQAIHIWLKNHYGIANMCECNKCNGKSKKYQWALLKNKNHSHNRENYIMLCSSCHRKYDMSNKLKIDIANTKMKDKKILQYSKQNKLINTWNNLYSISILLNINKNAVCNCLNNRAKTSAGFIWKYK